MRSVLITVVLLLFSFSSALHAEEPPATQPDAEAIWAEILAIPQPEFDESRADDEAYVNDYSEEMRQFLRGRAARMLKVYERDPDHPEARMVMQARWNNLRMGGVDPNEIVAEIERIITSRPNDARIADMWLQLAFMKIEAAKDDAQRAIDAAEEFIRVAPRDERGGDLLLAAVAQVPEQVNRNEMYRRIMLDYPGSGAGTVAAGRLRQERQIGMPFELGFFDAVTGEWIHTRNLRGKVIVIDFWATWCGPCVGAMPHLKELYAQYKDQGLEIVGVSLDGPRLRTDLDTLKQFVKDQGITWPQYYQGEGFDSAFSRSWGIGGIPTYFVIDAEGRLHSTDARGKLDELIPELLKQRENR